jgi:sugar phosphate isomerase/epimerase
LAATLTEEPDVLKLAAFADEISPDIDEQIRVCRACGVTQFELRSVNNTNVLDLDKPLREEVRRKIEAAGMSVVSIGSPIGKVKIDEPFEPHFDRFKIAVEMADFFKAPLIRLFSYYPPEGGDIAQHRDEVMRRMRAKAEYVKSMNVTLVHENEVKIYGDIGPRCVDLMKTVDSPKLRFAFDFANFVQAGDDPKQNWPGLKPYTAHIHIKDALRGSGKVVPAGEGHGSLREILKDAYASGYRGSLSLEPHLKAHEQFGGFSGADLFKVAVDALRKLCREIDVPLEGN